MTTPHIRPLQPSDQDRWRELWNDYIAFYQADVSDKVTELTWQRLLADRGHQCLVAQSAGDVVGFVTYLFHPSTWTMNGYCYLEDLFVDERCRGQGVGRALIESVVQAATNAEISRVYWVTDTDNAAARRLYDFVAKLSDMVQYRITTG